MYAGSAAATCFVARRCERGWQIRTGSAPGRPARHPTWSARRAYSSGPECLQSPAAGRVVRVSGSGRAPLDRVLRDRPHSPFEGDEAPVRGGVREAAGREDLGRSLRSNDRAGIDTKGARLFVGLRFGEVGDLRGRRRHLRFPSGAGPRDRLTRRTITWPRRKHKQKMHAVALFFGALSGGRLRGMLPACPNARPHPAAFTASTAAA